MKNLFSISFSTDNIAFIILFFCLLLGVFLYNPLHLDYADEIAAALLGITCLWHFRRKPKIFSQPAILVIAVVFLFYLIYSLIVKSNTPQAIGYDTVVSLKPFIGFFGVFLLAPTLSETQQKIIRYSCLTITTVCLLIAIYSYSICYAGDHYHYIQQFFGSVINFYLVIVVAALFYLYCSAFDRQAFLVFFLLLAVGIFSGRFKFFGFYFISIALFLSGLYKTKLKLTLKIALLTVVLLAGIFAVTYPKIHYYFVESPSAGGYIQEARGVLYSESFALAKEYFPFGTGFAGFGSYASTKFLAPIYEQHKLFEVLNLEEIKGNFATDAFYATLLGQFGVVGLLLFFSFFAWLFRQSLHRFSTKKQYFTLLIISFFLMESVSNSTFTQSFGLVVVMLLGYVLSKKSENIQSNA